MNILIVPDKFKGTLTANEAASAIARGWRKMRPRDDLRLLPMTDGGDGFGEVLEILLNAKARTLQTLDAAHRPCTSKWWFEPKSKTAVIDSSAVIGLAMLPPGKFHPFELDTFGLGKLLHIAAAKGAEQCLLGIGGSATNDAGFGLARALGWEFLSRDGNQIKRWTDLESLHRISRPKRSLSMKTIQVAVDVQNPLLGPRGATRIYGPQKGLTPKDFPLAERCLARLAKIAKNHFGHDMAREPGTGAAGGLGFGLRAFAGTQLVPGFELFAKLSKLQSHFKWADLVITGEGRIDDSTFMGKGVGEILKRCRKLKIPCLGIGGTIITTSRLQNRFSDSRGLTHFISLQQATKSPSIWLERAAADLARSFAIAI